MEPTLISIMKTQLAIIDRARKDLENCHAVITSMLDKMEHSPIAQEARVLIDSVPLFSATVPASVSAFVDKNPGGADAINEYLTELREGSADSFAKYLALLPLAKEFDSERYDLAIDMMFVREHTPRIDGVQRLIYRGSELAILVIRDEHNNIGVFNIKNGMVHDLDWSVVRSETRTIRVGCSHGYDYTLSHGTDGRVKCYQTH